MTLINTIHEVHNKQEFLKERMTFLSNDLANIVTARGAKIAMDSKINLNKEEALAYIFTQIIGECDEAIEQIYKQIKKPSKVKLTRFNASVVTIK